MSWMEFSAWFSETQENDPSASAKMVDGKGRDPLAPATNGQVMSVMQALMQMQDGLRVLNEGQLRMQEEMNDMLRAQARSERHLAKITPPALLDHAASPTSGAPGASATLYLEPAGSEATDPVLQAQSTPQENPAKLTTAMAPAAREPPGQAVQVAASG